MWVYLKMEVIHPLFWKSWWGKWWWTKGLAYSQSKSFKIIALPHSAVAIDHLKSIPESSATTWILINAYLWWDMVRQWIAANHLGLWRRLLHCPGRWSVEVDFHIFPTWSNRFRHVLFRSQYIQTRHHSTAFNRQLSILLSILLSTKHSGSSQCSAWSCTR